MPLEVLYIIPLAIGLHGLWLIFKARFASRWDGRVRVVRMNYGVHKDKYSIQYRKRNGWRLSDWLYTDDKPFDSQYQAEYAAEALYKSLLPKKVKPLVEVVQK